MKKPKIFMKEDNSKQYFLICKNHPSKATIFFLYVGRFSI
jgi:hypothetical protein